VLLKNGILAIFELYVLLRKTSESVTAGIRAGAVWPWEYKCVRAIF
jgi:hypothetical protein